VSEIDWDRVRDVALPSDAKGSLLPLIQPGFTLPLKDARSRNLRAAGLLEGPE
jgi:hypothetical protein